MCVGVCLCPAVTSTLVSLKKEKPGRRCFFCGFQVNDVTSSVFLFLSVLCEIMSHFLFHRASTSASSTSPHCTSTHRRNSPSLSLTLCFSIFLFLPHLHYHSLTLLLSPSLPRSATHPLKQPYPLSLSGSPCLSHSACESSLRGKTRLLCQVI